MADSLPTLYVKTGCPWCEEVTDFLTGAGIGYHEKNVTESETLFSEMRRLSGQSKAPVLDWHGKVLADFGVEELRPFLMKQGVKFEDS